MTDEQEKWYADISYVGNAVVRDRAEIVVYECTCGYHFGVDETYLDQVGSVEHHCPSCKEQNFIHGIE